jgi:hypothetical protein
MKKNLIDLEEFKQRFRIKSSGFIESLFKAFGIDAT